MADYRQIARRAAERYGFDPHVFERVIGQESGFNPHARSPAGAQGIAQIVPGTARAWGVDPSDPVASLDAAAKHLAGYVRKYGSYENALRAYNAGPGAIEASRGYSETNNYVSRILGGRDPGRLRSRRAGRKEAEVPGAAPEQPQEPAVPAAQTGSLSGGQQLAQLMLAQGLQEPQGPRPSMGLAAPAFAAGPALPAGAQSVVSSGGPRDSPGAALARALEAVKGLAGTDVAPAPDGGADTPGRAPDGPQATPGGSGPGRVRITGPNPGRIKPEVTSFLERISRVRGGKPVVGSDGTGHSKFTVNGNVSEHFTGNATDVPAAGADLIAQGQAALIAAGMPRAKARRQTGGLYNVTRGGRRYQIIFNTHEGGDHTDHLHVGVSRR